MITLSTPSGNMFFNQGLGIRQLSLETSTTLNILKSVSILAPSLAQNELGFFSYVDVGRNGDAKFGRFKKSEFNLRKRDASCTWNPNGGLTFGVETINTCAVQYEDELCPGTLWDTCWEKFLGTGMDKHDFFATPEGAAFIENVLQETFIAIGNDYFRLVAFAGHPSIIKADDEDYWIEAGTSPEKWASIKAQQLTTNCSGFLTTAEQLKINSGYDHFNVEILEADTNGARYTGDAIDLFNRLIEAQTAESAAWSLNGQQYGTQIISVTPGIYNRYLEQLRQLGTNTDFGMRLLLNGEGGVGYFKGVIKYNDYWVVARPEWVLMDQYTGITSHIAMLSAPGAIGIAGDVPVSEQWEGMGLVVTQRLGAPFKGKTYFESTFRAGGLILDHNFVTYASLFLEPA